MAVMPYANELYMNGIMTHNAIIIKNQIYTDAVKRITYPQILYVNVPYVYFNTSTL